MVETDRSVPVLKEPTDRVGYAFGSRDLKTVALLAQANGRKDSTSVLIPGSAAAVNEDGGSGQGDFGARTHSV